MTSLTVSMDMIVHLTTAVLIQLVYISSDFLVKVARIVLINLI